MRGQAHDFSMSVYLVWNYIFAGIKDSLKAWPHSITILYTSPKILKVFFKCLLLNGLIFLGSIWLFEKAIEPLAHLAFSEFVLITQKTLYMLYSVLWIYPVYILSFLLNSIWYQDIADFAYRIHHKAEKRQKIYFTKVLSDEIFRSLLVGNYLIITSLSYFIPIIGPVLSFLQLCWIYSFYTFEYNWINQGWPLENHLLYFEDRWAYFLGFGFPTSLLTFFVPQFVGTGFFAIIFPLCIIMSNVAKPLPVRASVHSLESKSEKPILLHNFLPQRMPIFSVPKNVTFFIIKSLKKKTK